MCGRQHPNSFCLGKRPHASGKEILENQEDDGRLEDGTEVNDQFHETWFREQAQDCSPVVIPGKLNGLWVYIYIYGYVYFVAC